jgi:hypothetical protein
MRTSRNWRKMSRPTRARINIILGSIAYVGALQWAHAAILTNTYAYVGFRYRDDPVVISATWLLALIPSLWMPSSLRRASQLAYWFFYLVVVVPVAVVTVHSYPGDAQSGILTAILIISAFAVLGLIYAVPLVAIPHHRFQPHGLWVAILLLSTFSYGLILFTFGLRLQFASLSDIYTVRAEYMQILENTNVYISYAVDWQALVLNPLLLLLGLISRRKLMALVGVIGQLLIYSFTGYRTVLFSTSVILLLLLVCRPQSRFGIHMLIALTGAVAGSAALYLWSGSLLLCSLIVERLVGLPGLLTGFYFSFFTHHPKMMLSHSVLRGIFDNPYGSVPPLIIGKLYFPSSGTYANANFWADAFANFGIWGVFIFTAILGLVFWLYDSMTLDTDLRLAALMLVMPAITLANTGLLTCLLTHGLAFACLVMYYLPNQIQAPAVSSLARVAYVPARNMRWK